MLGRASIVVFFALLGCARSSSAPSPPDVVEHDEREGFPELKRTRLQAFNTSLSQAEFQHPDQRGPPCAEAWRHLESLIALDHPVQAQTASFYQVCGCCVEAQDAVADASTDPG